MIRKELSLSGNIATGVPIPRGDWYLGDEVGKGDCREAFIRHLKFTERDLSYCT